MAADWTRQARAEYDPAAKPQPLTLFPAPDKCGTPDLFDALPVEWACDECGYTDEHYHDPGSGSPVFYRDR